MIVHRRLDVHGVPTVLWVSVKSVKKKGEEDEHESEFVEVDSKARDLTRR